MLLKSIKATLEKYNVKKLLVGFSGGVDSTVLLSLLSQIPEITVRAVYVNHGVSEHAVEWELFCKDFCFNHNIEFHSKTVDCTTKSRESFEDIARKMRYNTYKELLQDNEFLCLGQHSDDQVETVLLQLFRGTGLAGLSGMPLCDSFENGFILRPFLDTSLLTINKEEIEAYSREHNIKHIVDESNDSNDYRRNFLRNKIIPQIKSEFGNINKSITRTAKHCAETIDYINTRVIDIKTNAFKISTIEYLSTFEQKSTIQKWIKNQKKLALSTNNLSKLVEFVGNYKSDSNFKIELKDYFISHYNHKIYLIDKKEQKKHELFQSKEGKIPLIKDAVIVYRKDINQEVFFEKKPFKLKTFLNRLKIPLWEREHIPIYMLNNVIIAIGQEKVSKDFLKKSQSLYSFK